MIIRENKKNTWYYSLWYIIDLEESNHMINEIPPINKVFINYENFVGWKLSQSNDH